MVVFGTEQYYWVTSKCCVVSWHNISFIYCQSHLKKVQRGRALSPDLRLYKVPFVFQGLTQHLNPFRDLRFSFVILPSHFFLHKGNIQTTSHSSSNTYISAQNLAQEEEYRDLELSHLSWLLNTTADSRSVFVDALRSIGVFLECDSWRLFKDTHLGLWTFRAFMHIQRTHGVPLCAIMFFFLHVGGGFRFRQQYSCECMSSYFAETHSWTQLIMLLGNSVGSSLLLWILTYEY